MSERVALVTLTLGDDFAEHWHEACRPGWEGYAERHGYDVVCLTEPLDGSPRASARSPSWQKLLVLDQPFARDFDRIVWMDADIYVNPAAPAVVDGVPVEKVGAVDEFGILPFDLDREPHTSPFDLWEANRRRPATRQFTAQGWYAEWGLSPAFERNAHAGVLVLSPRHHRDLLAAVYALEDKPGLNLEMRPLSHEILRRDAASWIDPRFNMPWFHFKARRFPFLVEEPAHERAGQLMAQALDEVYFLHLAGEDATTLPRPSRPPLPPAKAGRRRRPPRSRVPVVSRIEDLDEVFDAHDAAIVLPDGCRVDPSFFGFCEELLERYRDDERVMSISGSNFQFTRAEGGPSYLFSRYHHLWGWATWARAWRRHDPSMSEWPRLRDEGWLEELLGDPYAARYWTYAFETADGWERAWTLSCWRAGGLSAFPRRNLVSRDDERARDGFVGLPVEALDLPLAHPDAVRRDEAADAFTEDVLFSGNMRRMFESARGLRLPAALR